MNLPLADSNLVPGRNPDRTQPSDRPSDVDPVMRGDTRRVPGDGVLARRPYKAAFLQDA